MEGGGFRFNFGGGGREGEGETVGEEAGGDLKPFEEVFPCEEPADTGIAPERHPLTDSLTLVKGRVVTRRAAELLGVDEVAANDLLPGRYEGGFKMWEGSDDLARRLLDDWRITSSPFSADFEPPPSISGKKVLELGCGHGLPGVLAAVSGAAEVHFADFNAEVLSTLTAFNVRQNLMRLPKDRARPGIRYLAGDWQLVCESLVSQGCGYDIILTSETTYSSTASSRLLKALELMMPPGSSVVAYVAAKSYYFGVGGGAQQFRQLVERGGKLSCQQVSVLEDGASNKREVMRIKRLP